MKSLAFTIVACVFLGGVAYAAIFFWKKGQIDHRHSHQTAFEWFCAEFEVTDAQRQRIQVLHHDYFPECEDHCVHYADTQQTLARITEDPNLNQQPEHAEAAKRLAQLEKEADKSFIDFVYRIADELKPEQSQRYRHRMKLWLDKAGNTPAN